MKGAQMAGINTAAVKISVFVIAGALVASVLSYGLP